MQTPHTYTHARDTPRVFKRIWLACGINMEFCCRNAQHTALPAARIMSHAIVTLSMHDTFCQLALPDRFAKSIFAVCHYSPPLHIASWISRFNGMRVIQDATFRGEAILSFSVVLNGRFKRDIGITLIFLRFSLFNLRGLTLFKWYGDILGGKRIISKLSKILLFVNDF